jgi:dolichol-phosphate mannosyltransferase
VVGPADAVGLRLLSVVIPARNEAESIRPTVLELARCLDGHGVPCEIVVVDDGSTDATWATLTELNDSVPSLRPVQNHGEHGYGSAILRGFDHATGDAVAVVMADASDDPEDLVRFWEALNEGYDCAFGTRWGKGTVVEGYPPLRRFLNRLVNNAIRVLFWLGYDDVTNGFKAYRRSTLDGCAPLTSRNFSLAVELPLRAIVRGYSYKVIPNSWRQRGRGLAKLRLWSMSGPYLFVILRCWFEARRQRSHFRKP